MCERRVAGLQVRHILHSRASKHAFRKDTLSAGRAWVLHALSWQSFTLREQIFQTLAVSYTAPIKLSIEKLLFVVTC